METRSYPRSLQLYKLVYQDNNCRMLYACGMTHVYAMSREFWPNDKIKEVTQLDDSWKN